MRVDLKKLKHALVVERLGSFTLAADELLLTQPTLSRSIASLEDLWGISLFRRERAGVVATSEGRLFLREAAKLIDAANAFDRRMTGGKLAPKRSIVVGMGPFVGGLLSSQVLALSSGVFDDANVSIVIGSPDKLAHDIDTGVVDFAIFSAGERPESAGGVCEALCPMPMAFLMRSDHDMAGKNDFTLEDLNMFPVVLTTLSNRSQLSSGPVIVCDDVRVGTEMVLSSDCIWYLSPWVLRREINSGQLCGRHLSEHVVLDAPSLWMMAKSDEDDASRIESLFMSVRNTMASYFVGDPPLTPASRGRSARGHLAV